MSLKAFEDATLWRPSLRPVRTNSRASEAGDSGPLADYCPVSSRSNDCKGHATVNTPQYRTENFMMYGFKIALCSRSGRHKWDDCPFAHPTENARRRDPRVFSYSCHECPSYRNAGYCPRGDNCEFSHGVFEARLHPDSYRTVACKDGENCRRKICFFYHNEQEARSPTGLHEARAQLVAELGESAFELSGDALRQVANNLLTSSPSLTSTMKSLNSAFSQPVCQTQTIRSVVSVGNTSPLAASQSLGNTAQLSSAVSGLSLGGNGNSGILMTTETIAPCMKGANRNKARLRELAVEVGVHAESLMNSLRIAAVQGELTPHCQAPSAPLGTFNDAVEAILEEIAETENLSVEKLRGWLQRQCTAPSSPSHHSPKHNSAPFSTFTSSSPEQARRLDQAFSSVSGNSSRWESTTAGRRSRTPVSPTGPGPHLPVEGNDDVIRAFGHAERQDSNGHAGKRVSWRASNTSEGHQRTSSQGQSKSEKGSWRPRGDKGASKTTRW